MARIPFKAKRRPTRQSIEKDRALTLQAVHPNAGVRAAYRRRLEKFIDQMARSFEYWLKVSYRANEPAMAQGMAMDATPAADLQKAINELSKRWLDNMDAAAPELAAWFAKTATSRSQAQLKSILKRGGFTVEFKMTPEVRDIMRATVEANVQLIKSIPEQYLTGVQGAVMRSVQQGRDLGQLNRDLLKIKGVTKRRAALISLDQNNKATSAIQRARQTQLGLDEGIWLHSHAGKEPRPTHLANHGKVFSITEGWYDPDPDVRRHIMPGELIRCRCTWKIRAKGFS